uniref:Chromosome 10 open reading frame 95 n=1 Tax=Aotus nancymaae TaxID=37293 RepID=A0A2K5E8J9_AOTNA
MYAYSWLSPREGVWPSPQSLTCAYLASPLLLPPIQAHSFRSRPGSLHTGEWAAPREYHRFYGPTAPPEAAQPWWACPPAYAAALRPRCPAAGISGLSLQAPAAAAESWTPWPEGSSLQTELRWGRVERARGPPLQLPDFVRRELRRAYGTYPRANVRVTQRRGQFLLQATPRVREPERRVECRVRRRHDSGDSSPGQEAAERGRPRKSKGLR